MDKISSIDDLPLKSSRPKVRVGVVDYGRGNLRSVGKALEAAGAEVEMLTAAGRFDSVDAVVVPGVGSFGDCARNLKSSGMWEPLQEWLRAGRPYLGICLGYQLLFESSEESPGASGLGHFPGRVVRFSHSGLKIPHMGWNTLSRLRGPLYRAAASPSDARALSGERDARVPKGTSQLSEVRSGSEAAGTSAPAFYFVHSYYPVPTDADMISATCEYGESFAASISRGAIHATQFHPEKSQTAGLALLGNFLSTL